MSNKTIIRFGFCVACSRLSVSEDDQKSERATSGISGEWDPGEKGTSPFSLPDPAKLPSSALSESLEQASFCDIQNNRGLGKGYQPQPYLNYSAYHKNLIQ